MAAVNSALPIERFEPMRASADVFAAVNAFSNRMHAERQPGDLPAPLDETKGDWRNVPPVYVDNAWLVWNAARTAVVALGDVWYKTSDDNRHLASFTLDVLPEYRRQGIGRRLLASIAAIAEREERRLLQTWTHERVPAGEAFMTRLGGKIGQTSHSNQLDLSQLDHALIEEWLARGRERAAEFELVFNTGPFPDDQIAEVVALREVMNSMPHDDLEVEDWEMTPEVMRQFERNIFERGLERWTMHARHIPSGELAGFTEVVWSPHRPDLLEQWGTGVLAKFRGNGLGRWLKAAMIERVVRERPQVKRIRTSNAFSNAPMLKINFELGFQPYQSVHTWQVPTQNVLDYLNERARSVRTAPATEGNEHEEFQSPPGGA